ncbi:hypothetical protein MUO32_23745 [Shinella sp. CPCC 101442]|uniref:hypothetical protein n=1 Tax=Shinella sp. CPCC 101442 TaxID=2932265 RepID=UPI0021539A79|nr:hypothetical protein [Shinella sp. CPCC 101442]MCR6502046.1 hypothetical protein [Shinella sp. CPCC 101442]
MTKPDSSKTAMPTPVVEDPHPGSISDGTHPAAREHKQPKPTKGNGEGDPVAAAGSKPNLKDGKTEVAEAPRLPNKGAYGS